MYTQLYKKMHSESKNMKEAHKNTAILDSRIAGNFYCFL